MENTKQMKISLLRDQVDIPKIGASKVLVEVVDGEEVLKSGIIIPGAAQENRPVLGEIIRIGSAVEDWNIGDLVIFSHYSGVEMKLRMKTRVGEELKDAKPFKLITDIDIWGTIKKVEE